MAEEEDNDNADKNTSKIHLIVGTTVVTVGPHVGVPEVNKNNE